MKRKLLFDFQLSLANRTDHCRRRISDIHVQLNPEFFANTYTINPWHTLATQEASAQAQRHR